MSHDAAPPGPWHVDLERLSYATVVLMSVLVVYDGWADLTTFAGVAAVIVAPVIALTVAHVFSEALQHISDVRRSLTRAEWRQLVRTNSRSMLVAVPPLVVTGLGWVSPINARSTISVLLVTGTLTLIVLASTAGHRAGLRGWRLVLAGVVGGLVGLIVVSLQILLKPY